MSRPRVLMIIAQFYPALGGAENQALLLCRALVRQGVDVAVLTRRVQGLPDRENVCGVQVSRSIRVLERGKLFGVTYFLSCLFYLVAHCRNFDIIHCHILQGLHSPAAVCMKYLFGKKVIIKVANTGALSDFTVLKASLLGTRILGFLRHADRVVALCRRSVDEARADGFSDTTIVVIPNGVDAERFTPAHRCPAAPRRILYAGRLAEEKRLDVLIDAFSSLKCVHTDLVLDIFGSGPLHESLRNKAHMLGLAASVRFHGTVPDIERCFDRACILVQPSLAEGMSNIILEAMAAGLPVVATRTGAAEDIIQDGVNGLLVDSGSADQMHAAIARLLSDEASAERIGREARALIALEYTIEKVAARYRGLYHELLGTVHQDGTIQ